MKEALVASGSLNQCTVVATELARSSVVDTTKEKPVTKKMLKEVYHWDECLDCKIIWMQSECDLTVHAVFFMCCMAVVESWIL